MTPIKIEIKINANPKRVWDTLITDETYRIWTAPFHEGSHFVGSWAKGSEIMFLGPDENGNLGGMFSIIEENELHTFISIKHLGVIKNGKPDTTSKEAIEWKPSYERYYFSEENGVTTLKSELEVPEKYKSMFEDMFSKAMLCLKQLCEE